MGLSRNLSNPTKRVWARVLLAVFVFVPAAAAAPTTTMIEEEIHHYREVTGTSSKEVSWHLTRGDTLVLTYTSPTERHITTTGHGYRTIRWQAIDTAGGTDFVAERGGDTISIEGRFKDEPIRSAYSGPSDPTP